MQCLRRTAFALAVLTASAVFALPAPVDPADKWQNNARGGDKISHSQVIIIGAGSSGVAAASRLMENGVMNVTILEAEDWIGGRVHTVPFGDHVVDLGAQWVHGSKGNVVYEMAAPLGLLLEDVSDGVDNPLYLRADGQVPNQNVLDHLQNISLFIANNKAGFANNNGSFGQYFVEKYAEYIIGSENEINADLNLVLMYANWFEKYVAFNIGADSWFNVSCKGLVQNEECEGNQNISWRKNGYGTVIDLLTKRYPHPKQELPVRQKTHLNTEVKTINSGRNGIVGPTGKSAVLIEDSNGGRYTADIVLVTVSLGVLKERATTMFNPPLPFRKMNAVKHIGFGQVNKIFLHFDEAWWPANKTGFTILINDEDRMRFYKKFPMYKDKGEWVHGLTGFYVLLRQPKSVLFDWIVGEPARNIEKYSDSDVMLGCLKWLELFVGRTLPLPTSFIRSNWYSNPHFRGSYSHRSMDSELYDAQPADLAEPLLGPNGTPNVLFAGEATEDIRFSTVHGAIETGWREADRILKLLGKENRSRKGTSV